MVPQAFTTFFSTSAAAGAALVGLLFVAVSIAPHETVKSGAPIERQAVSSSAFTALLNAFFISLGALIPKSNLGDIALVMGLLGLLNTLGLTRHLLKEWLGWRVLVQRGLLVVASIILYGYEVFFASSLVAVPTDLGPLYGMTGLLLGVYGLGILRAWQLLGARRFGFLSGWLSPLHESQEETASPSTRDAQESAGD